MANPDTSGTKSGGDEQTCPLPPEKHGEAADEIRSLIESRNALLAEIPLAKKDLLFSRLSRYAVGGPSLQESERRRLREELPELTVIDEKIDKTIEGCLGKDKLEEMQTLAEIVPGTRDLAKLARKFDVSLSIRANPALGDKGSGRDAISNLTVDLVGKEIKLPLNGTSLEEREAALEEYRKRLITSMEEDYPVKILRAGMLLSAGQSLNKVETTSLSRPEMHTVEPRIQDLLGLEDALKKSKTTLLTGSSREAPLRFAFVDESPKIAGTEVKGLYFSKLDNEPTILLFREKFGSSISASTTRHFGIHEVGHRHQDLEAWLNSPEKRRELTDPLGWHFTGRAGLEWALETKDGRLFSLLAENDGLGKRWVRVDSNGALLNSQGKPAKAIENAEYLTGEQLFRMAKVRPASQYFDNPVENFAEGMRLFRSGYESRFELLVESPELYEIIRLQDQLEIDKYMAKFHEGKSGLRDFDGEVRPTAVPEKDLRARFEDRTLSYAKAMRQALDATERIPNLDHFVSQIDNFGLSKQIRDQFDAGLKAVEMVRLNQEAYLVKIASLAAEFSSELSQLSSEQTGIVQGIFAKKDASLRNKEAVAKATKAAMLFGLGRKVQAIKYLESVCKPNKEIVRQLGRIKLSDADSFLSFSLLADEACSDP